MKYQSTKTFGHEVGLSCCFRQWRADHSHCQYLHGYAIAVRLVFESTKLDERNWVMDFGGLTMVKNFLRDIFDHKTLVAADDPLLEEFKRAAAVGLMQIVILPNVGCEAFAQHIFGRISTWIRQDSSRDHIALASVEVMEHGANSAKVIA